MTVDETLVVEDQAADGTVEVRLSKNKTVVLRELTGADVRLAQRLTGTNYGMNASNQALISIVSINGEKLVPVKTETHLEARVGRFKGLEYLKLTNKYFENFGDEELDPNE